MNASGSYSTSFDRNGNQQRVFIPGSSSSTADRKPSKETRSGTYCTSYDRKGNEIRVFIPNRD